MAIQKTVVTNTGFSAINAYHKIGVISVENKSTLVFSLTSHKDKDSLQFSSCNYSCAYDLGGHNTFVQAYNHIKSLPEFSDAVDC